MRCAFWLGLRLLFRGEGGRASGWFARAERLVESETSACAERGYLLLPAVEQAIRGGELDKAASIAAAIVEIAEQFADSELLTCSQLDEGRILLLRGDVASGLAHLDELMLAVTANALSPIVTGLMYCAVIGACQEVCAASRAREWTFALSDWCGQQPEMVSFTSSCLVHRAEVMRLHGEWSEALAAHVRGEIELAEDDAYAALVSLRRALGLWQELKAPYLAAGARVSIAVACRTLGDEDGAALELESARAAFERLEAAPDLAHVDALRARPHAARSASHGLTQRELEVLRLVSTGRTNRQIAFKLTLSEKTVDRHVSNIFAKLDVPSRAAATAYAFRHRLL